MKYLHNFSSVKPCAIVLVASLMLNACAISMTPNNQIGYAQAQAQGKIMSEAQTKALFQVESDWWQSYHDPKLNQLVELALARNIDLKQAALNVNKALYQANILGANLVPSYNGALNASTQTNLNTGNRSRSYSAQLGLSYELDLWRKLNATASAQVWEARATEEDLASTRLTLINNVADTYFKLGYLNASIALQQKDLARYQEIARITESKYRLGSVSVNDSMQAQQSLLSAQTSLRNLELEKAQAETTLRNLLNLRPNESVNDLHLDQISLPPSAPVNLDIPLNVLAARPDLRAADYRLQAALKNQIAQYRSWYPSISLSGSISSSAERSGSLFKVPFWGGSAGISLPFLNWPTLKWQDKTAEANFESAKLSFEQTLTTALNELANYYQQYQTAKENLQRLQTRYELDQKNTHYYQVRYRYGRNELKDWLDALNTENASAQNLLNQRYSVLSYESMVYKAMAGRYQPAAVK